MRDSCDFVLVDEQEAEEADSPPPPSEQESAATAATSTTGLGVPTKTVPACLAAAVSLIDCQSSASRRRPVFAVRNQTLAFGLMMMVVLFYVLSSNLASSFVIGTTTASTGFHHHRGLSSSSTSTTLFYTAKKVNKSRNPKGSTPKNPREKSPQREKSFKKLTETNDMMTNHRHRIETAGKIGTQRYADPTRIYIGNLNFTTTEAELRTVLEVHVPSPWDITKIQIVKDWKTGDSKGFAFVQFTEPVYATICLQELENLEFKGRRLKVKAANSNSESPLRQQQRAERDALKALRRAQNPPPPPPPPKPENADFLKFLDADLIVPGLDNLEANDEDDDEYDGYEVPGSKPPKGFG